MNKTLIEKYKKEAVPALKEKFGYKNNLSIPFLEKIVVNAGVGRLSQTPNFEEKGFAGIDERNVFNCGPAAGAAKG